MTAPTPLDTRYRRSADTLIITAGAGVGVDSGLLDFGNTERFWRAYPALAKGRIRFRDVADPATFRTRSYRTRGFYAHRLNLYRRPCVGNVPLAESASWLKYEALTSGDSEHIRSSVRKIV